MIHPWSMTDSPSDHPRGRAIGSAGGERGAEIDSKNAGWKRPKMLDVSSKKVNMKQQNNGGLKHTWMVDLGDQMRVSPQKNRGWRAQYGIVTAKPNENSSLYQTYILQLASNTLTWHHPWDDDLEGGRSSGSDDAQGHRGTLPCQWGLGPFWMEMGKNDDFHLCKEWKDIENPPDISF